LRPFCQEIFSRLKFINTYNLKISFFQKFIEKIYLEKFTLLDKIFLKLLQLITTSYQLKPFCQEFFYTYCSEGIGNFSNMLTAGVTMIVSEEKLPSSIFDKFFFIIASADYYR
jgi:hypothetical protein